LKKTIICLGILLFVSIGSNVYIYMKSKTEKISPQLTYVKPTTHFSYIASFSKKDKLKYSNFLRVGNSNELKGFTPTQNLLIYFDMVEKDNINGIYNLTFKDEMLPTRENFDNAYTSSDAPYNSSKIDALIYRNYDKAGVTFVKDKESATISINTGKYTTATAYSFKRNQDGVWQIELSHMFEVSKSN